MVGSGSSMRALALMASVIISAASASDNCFWRSDNTINPQPGWFACNNTQVGSGTARLCCFGGTTCGEDSLCRSNDATGGDDYYLGGCTDGDYSDPVCNPTCSGDSQTWVTYNSTEKLWHCCGSNGCGGGATTSKTFSALSPNDWSPLPKTQIVSSSSSPTASATGSTSTTASTSSTPSDASSSPSSDPSDSSDDDDSGGGLSTGAMAGIGVGAALGGLVLIGGAIFLFMRKRRRDRANTTINTGDSEASYSENATKDTSYKGYNSVPQGTEPVEAPGPDPHELSNTEAPRIELPGDEVFGNEKK